MLQYYKISGVLLRSSYDYPGRYARWTVGIGSPAVQIEGMGCDFNITALNARGEILVRMINEHLLTQTDLFTIESHNTDSTHNNFTGIVIKGKVIQSTESKYFPEEERSKQPSLFSLTRTVRDIFYGDNAGQLGLYGALGYDLTFQFEPVPPQKERIAGEQRDLVLFLPDEVLVIDNQKNDAWKVRYDFTAAASGSMLTTIGLPRESAISEYHPFEASSISDFQERDSEPGKYAENVVRAKEEFKVGNLFEVVLSQIFRRKMHAEAKPSTIFKR